MTDCAICFSEVTAATGRTVMSCGHEYHMRCLFQWLQKPDGTGNCPCCRHEPTEHERLVAPSTDDSDSEGSDDESEADPRATALMRAAYAGDAALVERLLTTGGIGLDGEGGRAEPLPIAELLEERDEDGDTALVAAICGENAQIVGMLISAGANINNRNEDGATPLIWAIRECEEDEIALDLIRRGADLTAVTGEEEEGEEYSALEFAAEYDMVHVLQAILERGVGCMGEALQVACASGARFCALALLEAGVDPNYQLEAGGLTPLMQCVSNAPDSEIVSALIRHGANVNATDAMGWNALMWMTQSEEGPDSDVMAAIQDAQSKWERGPDGRWREVMQSWGDGDVAPPPYRLAEHTRAAARRIQALYRGWSTRRRLEVPAVEVKEAAIALCWLRLQRTVAVTPVASPRIQKQSGDWLMERMTRVL
jgi:ankyrin repeat protein